MTTSIRQNLTGTGVGIGLLFLTACSSVPHNPSDEPTTPSQPTTSAEPAVGKSCLKPGVLLSTLKTIVPGACGLILGGVAAEALTKDEEDINGPAVLVGAGAGVYFCGIVMDKLACE